jgi:hypothetical protein
MKANRRVFRPCASSGRRRTVELRRGTPRPEIGDELAAARALSDLGHQLLLTAAADIEAAVNEPAHVTW